VELVAGRSARVAEIAAVTRRLLVAVHDVTPAHAEALQRIYALLQRIGITRYALLVVPDWHGAWPLDRHPPFVDDLLARQAAGAEIFLHGYRHDEAGTRRTLGQHLRVAGRTAAEAEFRIIPPEEAERRLDRGLDLFRRLGITPVGFIPPAWLHGRGALAQLRARELRYTEGFWRITRVADRAQRVAPALSWSSAVPWRSRLTAGIATVRHHAPWIQPVVRVAIHPPDILIPLLRDSVAHTLRWLWERREAVTYEREMGKGKAER
jgi:predicted deacetylase